jgi:DNA-binding response OmpR family regulator
MKQKITALIVEDDDSVIEVVSKKLKSMGHNYMVVKNQEEANSLIEEQAFDYLLLDLKLPVDKKDINPDSSTGFNLLGQIRAKYSKTYLPIIVMTAYEKNIDSAVDVMKKGANDFVEKPFKSGELEKKIQTILCASSSNLKVMGKRIGQSKQNVKFDIIIDENQPNLMIVRGKEIELTLLEFKFMCFLAKHPKTRLTNERIMINVWGNDIVENQRIPSVKDGIHKKIKNKIRSYNTSKFIVNIRATGWMLDVPQAKVKIIPKKIES